MEELTARSEEREEEVRRLVREKEEAEKNTRRLDNEMREAEQERDLFRNSLAAKEGQLQTALAMREEESGREGGLPLLPETAIRRRWR